MVGQDAVHKFISSRVKESTYCSHMMKKHFNKEFVLTKEHYDGYVVNLIDR